MKVIIDISDRDFNSIRYGGLYAIGHDRLDQVVTEAFNTATIIPEDHKDLVFTSAEITGIRGALVYLLDAELLPEYGYTTDVVDALESALNKVRKESENETDN